MNDVDMDLEGRVAVIGVAGRFPGAPDVETFWSNLRNGVESVTYLTEDELLAAGVTLDTIRDPSYVPACAPLADIDKFDAGFFGMSPRDAAIFDPQHRVFLECAWEAFEDAGYVGSRIDGSVGVFASCGLSEYMFNNVLANAKLKSSVGEWLIRHTGNDTNFLATRVSYELDLRGPSMNVQTACSSTLVAIHLACQSLLSGECDLALAGGAVIAPIQDRGYFYKEGEILSPDGHCRAFDAESAGTILSSAAGCVLLKPLAAAVADGDRIVAVVRGSAINNDGRAKVGFLAPSVGGQANVISEALAVADVDPRDVTYVEMHGTGTLIGDPIEVAGITEAFQQGTDDVQFCAIGSLKTNIGHAGEAAGISAFIKTVLALEHAEIPPSLHYRSPNPQADLPHSPFFVNDRLRPWDVQPGRRRIAGITGLGAGGTNAHVIVEEAPTADPSGPSRAEQLLVVSARSSDAVERAAADLAAHLRAHPDEVLADVAYTRLTGRATFRHRRAVVASTTAGAAAALESKDPAVAVKNEHVGPPPSVVFMMPGGGAQYAGMGAGLYADEPAFTAAIDACSAHLRRRHGIDLHAVFSSEAGAGVDDDALQRPSLALPALFTVEYATAKLLESWGITPTAMIGHSAGEYVVACLSGVITMEEGLDLIVLRGRLFETLPPGRMLSVSLSEADTRARMPAGLSIAAINAPKLCVVSGPSSLIADMQQDLERDDIDHMQVPIDVAAHSSMLDPILDEFRAFCRTVPFRDPVIPYVSNLTGGWITAAEAKDAEYWVRHLRESVRFADGVATILADAKRVLVEIGPGRTLTGLARLAEHKAATVTPTLRHVKDDVSDVAFALLALGRIWCAGVEVDAGDLFAGETRRRVPLPTYPFERHPYWVDPDPVSPSADVTATLHKIPDVAEWFSTPTWRQSLAPSPTDSVDAKLAWLIVSDGAVLAETVRSTLIAAGHRAVTVSFGDRFATPAPDRFVVQPSRAQDWADVIRCLTDANALPDRIMHMSAIGPSRGRKRFGLGDDPFAAFEATVQHDEASLLFLAQALSATSVPMRLAVVTSGVHDVGGGPACHLERALLHGTCRVIPRELGNMTSISIDLDESSVTSTGAAARVAGQLVDELRSDPVDDLAVIRGTQRWTRTFDQIRVPPTAISPWQPGATYLITGGLGGIGLAIAEHIAEVARDVTLELVGRTPFPAERDWAEVLLSSATSARQRHQIEALQRMQKHGANVVISSADVTDLHAMARVVAASHARTDRITGVIHAAGVLHDALLALRTPIASSPVVDVKGRGMLVLDRLLEKRPPDFVVLCSSVASIIGLPGQADYTAANAFLDAFAAQRNRDGRSRFVSINWSAWQEVGMAVDAVEAAVRRATPATPAVREASPRLSTTLIHHFDDDGSRVTATIAFNRREHWLLDEHVVRGGRPLIPGTGHLELLREIVAAGTGGNSPIELTDVFFLSPFIVADNEVRPLHIEFDRPAGNLSSYSDTASSPHVTASARVVTIDAAPRHDLAAIRSRCTVRAEVSDGFPDQVFMTFGPRWGNLRRIDYGTAEALVSTEMPEEFVPELDDLWLHPALLDMATGNAQALISDYSRDKTFYVPFSYGRVLVRGPLPKRAFSHVRLRESAQDTAIFDITIMDDNGDEVVAVDGFMMRLAPAGSLIVAPQSTSGSSSPLENPIEAAVREGILPAEGVDALDRILGHDIGAQVAASAIDIRSWVAKTDIESRAHPEEVLADGPRFGRPEMDTQFEPPATPIERELAEIWRDLLGVVTVGRNDDFFELGGQSLIAVRLFTRIRKRYSVDLPLATLFEAPTIAECAAVVAFTLGVDDTATEVDADANSDADATADKTADNDGTADTEPVAPGRRPVEFRSLVTIQRGGDRIPYFCVHGAGGNVLNFRDMSRAMGHDQPFYGLQAHGIDGVLRPLESIEEMASAYLREVRAVQPNGTYVFGGYSGGGLIAYEMARQATAAGATVALVLLLDTVPVTTGQIPVTMAMRLKRLREVPVKYLSEIYTRRRARYLRNKDMARLREILARDEVVPSDLREMHVEHCMGTAAASYTRPPWTGRVVLVRATEPHFIFDSLGESYGWDKIVDGGVEVLRVPGDHDTLMLEPNASVLVGVLRDVLDSTLEVASPTNGQPLRSRSPASGR